MAFTVRSAALFDPHLQHRAMLACVATSIGLHAAALFLLPGLRIASPAEGTKILTAVLAPITASAPAPAQAIEPRRVATPPPSQPRRERTPSPSLTLPAPSPQALPPQPEPEPATALNPPEQAAAPAPVALTELAAVQSSNAAPPAAKAGTEIGDAGTVRKYLLDLVSNARRYKRYPAQAMEQGWQGKVEIRLVIGANGTVQDAVVKSSSGYRILDDQALDMVRKAKPLTPIPPALRGREFTVDIPIFFDLQTG